MNEICYNIRPLDPRHWAEATAHLNNLTKPQGSLGYLEHLAARLYAMQQGRTPLQVDPAIMYTVAADHGVAAENVSPYPQAVTRQMVHNFLQQGAAINVLCACHGIDLCIVDAGCVGGPFASHPMLLDARLGEGTANFTQAPAMDKDVCCKALHTGIDIATQAANKGYRCLGVGEMGIANTTAATALLCTLLQCSPKDITGPGAGMSPQGVLHKIHVIERALAHHAAVVNTRDTLACLAALGGFEIAVMAGIMLGGAHNHMAVLVDGFISTAAFMVARALCPMVEEYGFLCHLSAEPGFAVVTHCLKYPRPILHLDLRLGEGTGAVLAMPIIRSAVAVYNDMATFSQAGVTGAKVQ